MVHFKVGMIDASVYLFKSVLVNLLHIVLILNKSFPGLYPKKSRTKRELVEC